jgi:hypothetical protein
MVSVLCYSDAMELTPYVDDLRRELAVAAAAGGDEARDVAERLTAALEPAARLMLLNALSAAAADVTRELAPGAVEVRLRGLDPEFVVTPAPADDAADDAWTPPPASDEGATARINLRLPDALKLRVEQAAAREGLSVNAWLVRAIGAAVQPQEPSAARGGRSGRQHFKGWVS